MTGPSLEATAAQIGRIATTSRVGRVRHLSEAVLWIGGLGDVAALGDLVEIRGRDGRTLSGEVVQVEAARIAVSPQGSPAGFSVGDRAYLRGPSSLAPDQSWIGRVIDPSGKPLDGRPLIGGTREIPLRQAPPDAVDRRGLGARLEAGLAAFNTVLPIVTGQRIGIFAGAGVGKSTLIGGLAKTLQADVVVIALIGERGREVRHFVDCVLGKAGMEKAVVVAATSDRSAVERRRCAWSAMAVAEYFRDAGRQVLLIADSVTRFAEAHRDVAFAAGEAPAIGGHPASLSHQLMALAERAGPGTKASGDITAVLSVLVAGSDTDEPVSDIMRGVLDGHIILDRGIAERGRFPAIDLLQSVSRSLPAAATTAENALIADARALLGAYDRAELMIQSGLYVSGSDPVTDRAIRLWPALDAFLGTQRAESAAESFDALRRILAEEPAPKAKPAPAAAP